MGKNRIFYVLTIHITYYFMYHTYYCIWKHCNHLQLPTLSLLINTLKVQNIPEKIIIIIIVIIFTYAYWSIEKYQIKNKYGNEKCDKCDNM